MRVRHRGQSGNVRASALAACLATGPRAVISHVSAGAMWGWRTERAPLHVTVTGQITTRPSGVIVHRTKSLPRADAGKLRRVPVTSPTRTLLDLAASLPEDEFHEILQRAVAEGCVHPARLRQWTGGRRRSPGATAIRAFLPSSSQRTSHLPTPLERAVADVLRDVGSAFEREHPVVVGGQVFYLDFAFPHLRVGVEADGRRWHSDAQSFEHDRQRDNALTAAGWRILRVTERQVRTDPAGIRDRVRELVVRG